MPAKPYILLGLLTACLVSLAVVSRNWSCRERRHGPFHERRIETYGPWEVLGVESGNLLVCRHGRHDRRTTRVTLLGIDCSATEPLATQATQKLQELVASGPVTIRAPENAGPDGWARELCGTVEASGGACLQTEMIRSGVAMIDPLTLAAEPEAIPKAWIEAERDAKKHKRGVWAQ